MAQLNLPTPNSPTTNGVWGTPLNASLQGMNAEVESKVGKDALPVNAADFLQQGADDDTAALQNALDAAATQGRPVVLPTRPLGQPYVVTLQSGKDYMLAVSGGQVISGDTGGRTVIRVKPGTGNYRAVFAGATVGTDLSGLTIRDITVDQNTYNNPVTSNPSLFAGFPRYAIYVAVGTGINIHGNRFINVDSVNTVVVAGANVADVRIQDNQFELVGASGTQHDHSTVYTSAQGQTITGNVFYGVAGGLGATTALETHGGQQIATGNRIRNYFCGMNITGVANAGSNSVLVANNVITGSMIGIDLWSYAGTNGGLRNCDVSHNVISIDRDMWIAYSATSFPSGIMLNPTNTDHIDGLRIQSNTINVLDFTAGAAVGELKAAGIALWHGDNAMELRNLDVYDNVVTGALSAGLRLQATVKRGKISRNRFINPGASTEAAMASFYRAGITIVGTSEDLIVENNDTYDTRSTHKVAQGVMTSVTAVTRGVQRLNTAVCTDGAVVPGFVQTVGKLFTSSPDTPVAPRFKAGLYYGPDGGRSVVTTAAGTLFAVPFWVPVTQSFDRIGCEVTVVGAASSLVRLGVYADAGDGSPSTLILDAGTVTGDVAGTKEINISLTLPAGLYWLASVGQGGTPQIRSVATTNVLGAAGASTLAVATGSAPRMGYTMLGATGSLPNPFVQAGQSALPGLVVLRAV